MALERTALDHACHVIRRQVLEEFHDLTLLFVVYKDGQKEKALAQESGALLGNPDGKTILRSFTKAIKTGEPGFLGLVAGTKKSSIPLFKQKHLYGLFVIDTDAYQSIEHARLEIYHLVWHAIDLREAYLSGDAQAFTLNENLVLPLVNDDKRLAEKHLIADVFTALTMEMQDKNAGHIKRLAAWRSKKTLHPYAGYEAEKFPYPVAMETTQLVYEDLKDSLDPKLGMFQRAVQLAKEVGMTHDAQSIRQWESFSFPAQEMAWSGCDPETILSAAVFASEDAYVKATAYLVSEAIDVKPQSLANLDLYNPFAETETNERFHRKACEAAFQSALAKALPTLDPEPFLQEAQRQVAGLMNGDILGWCAHGMIAAAQTFSQAKTAEEVGVPATLAYWESYNMLPWKNLQALSCDIMRQKRTGMTITRLDMEALLEKYPDLSDIRSYYTADDAVLVSFRVQRKTKIIVPAAEQSQKRETGSQDSDFDFFSGKSA